MYFEKHHLDSTVAQTHDQMRNVFRAFCFFAIYHQHFRLGQEELPTIYVKE